MTELRELLDEGYEVTLQRDGDREYQAYVRLSGESLHTGRGRTPEIAVWRASPLHEDGALPPQPPVAAVVEAALAEAMEVDFDSILNMVNAVWQVGYAYGVADDETRQSLDEERRHSYERFRAATERPRLRLV